MNNLNDQNSPFLPSTYNVPEEDDRLSVWLVDRFSNFANSINDKKIGNYTQDTERQNGEKWKYLDTKKTRTGYQAIAFIPSYPNASTLTLTLTSRPKFPISNINPQFVISKVYGNANKPCTKTGAGDGDYFSFMAQGDSRISFTMSDTQIVITTTTDLTAYQGTIVIEYIRDGV